MKGFFIFLFTGVAITINSQAQITIGENDVATVGTEFKVGNDTLPAASIKPGKGGANQTWNFAGLVNDVTDTNTFTNPNWIPFDTAYPSANLAISINTTPSKNNAIAFAKNSSSDFDILGQVITSPVDSTKLIAVKLNPSEVWLQFPTVYNSNFFNTSGYDVKLTYSNYGIDSVRSKNIKNKNDTVDAWGNIITPLGTYNSLRTKEFTVATDTIWIHTPSGGWQLWSVTQDRTVHYAWWVKNFGYPFVQMDSLTNGTIKNVAWVIAAPTQNGVNELAFSSAVSVYPNPSNGQFQITAGINQYKMEVYNVFGECIHRQICTQAHQQIELSSQPNGIYFFRCIDKSNKIFAQEKFIINK